MDVTIQVSQSLESIEASQRIRNEVFFEEQGIPVELDMDGRDSQSYHMLAYVNGQVIGTARLTPIENSKATLSRIAVKKEFRGGGIASRLVKTSLIQAKELGIESIEMTPHEHLQTFYEAFGFTYVESAGEVIGHKLIKMEASAYC